MRVFLKKYCIQPSSSYSSVFTKAFATMSNINSSKDYYLLLGVTNKADAAEIKKSFYQLAKKHHPDMNKGNEEKFKEINEAYEVLSDESKRREYDELRRVSSSENTYNSQNTSSYNGYNTTKQQNPHAYGPNTEQKYYYYEVKNDKGTYRKGFKQEGPFNGNPNQRRDPNMGLNEEILQEFMKNFYGNRMNPQQQQSHFKAKQAQNANQYNKAFYGDQAFSDEFMRQRFGRGQEEDFYEDYKADMSRREEEIRRQRDYEKLQQEKQVIKFGLGWKLKRFFF